MSLDQVVFEQAVLVTYSWNNETPTTARYANSANPVTIAGVGTFEPLPELEIDHGKQFGSIEDEYMKIRTIAVSPIDALAAPYAHSRIEVSIATCDVNDPDNSYIVWFEGHVAALLADAGNQKGVYEARIAGIRDAMRDVPVGIAAQSRCPNTFGDIACGVSVGVLEEAVTITQVNNTWITVSGLATTNVSQYWKEGHIRVGENRIKITRYGTGSTFRVDQTPPPDWEGKAATMRPGCRKTKSDCQDRWNNQDRFLGFGLLIPSEDPRFTGV